MINQGVGQSELGEFRIFLYLIKHPSRGLSDTSCPSSLCSVKGADTHPMDGAIVLCLRNLVKHLSRPVSPVESKYLGAGSLTIDNDSRRGRQ